MAGDRESQVQTSLGSVTPEFRLIFEALPTAYLVMDTNFVIIEANPAYQTLLSRTREELVGKPVFEAFPPLPESLDEHGRNPIDLSFRQARDTGIVDSMPIQRYPIQDPETGEVTERYWSLISAPIKDDNGTVVAVMQRTEDVSDFVHERENRKVAQAIGEERRRQLESIESDLFARAQELRAAQAAKDEAARRLASLGEVALQLTAAETLEDLEQTIVDRGLRVLGADGGGIISPDGFGDWRATLSTLGEEVQIGYGNVPYDSPLPAPWVARTGERLLLGTMAEGLAFHEESMSAVYVDTKRKGWAFLPLIVGDACLGSLAVAFYEEHYFSDEELDLMAGFAAQCAQALDRLRSVRVQREAALAVQRMSETLQRSLLTKPATPEPLEIAVRYQPAAEQAQVGGDWYDAFLTTAGATMLVVGDVTGHDRAAAATMGQFRNLLRGMAYDSDDGPAQLLSRLDAALRGLEIDSLATAVLARIEESNVGEEPTWTMHWSNAGHLPPLLRQPDGSVEVLDGTNDLLLGIDPRTSRSERSIELQPGATLVLFTDGLVERRNSDLDQGIARLRDQLEHQELLDPERLCDSLLRAVAEDANFDDIALLVLQVKESAPQFVPLFQVLASEQVEFAADPRAVREARKLTARLCNEVKLSDEIREIAVLLTSEVVTNAVVHGRSEARISVSAGPNGVRVEVGDDNSQQPVLQPHDDEALSGRGISMLDVAASEWGVLSNETGKVVWFVVSTSDHQPLA